MSKLSKPLGGHAYGSIGHLPGSRLGEGDHTIHQGQADILTLSPRRGDRIIVSEKLDGACMAVAKIGGEIVPLTRAGYRASDGTYDHLRAFHGYAMAREKIFAELLSDGERVVGEWLSLAHGTMYDSNSQLFEPFVAFDIIGADGKRVLYDEFEERLGGVGIDSVAILYDGEEGFSIEDAITTLGRSGYHGALDEPEGAVWRVEREGRVDFLAKYVRPNKIDGLYLPNLSGRDPIWIWQEAA